MKPGVPGGIRAREAAPLFAVLAAASGCRSDRRPEAAAGPAPARLVSSAPLHDFGRILEGAPMRHTFTVTNGGEAPVRIGRVDRSPRCRPGPPPPMPLPPGGSVALAVECEGDGRLPKLVEKVLVHPEGGPPLTLELRATIDPLLAFETTLVTLETTAGRPVSQLARLVGPLAGVARLEVKEVGMAAGLRARPLPPRDRRGPGLELSLGGGPAGEHAGRVLVGTGLDRPRELVLPYLARVKSGIEVDPARPYFNLHAPSGRSLLLSVKSGRPGFRLRSAEVVSGFFTATLEGGGARVSVDEARVPPGERGILGTLVLVTNDPAEPRKEIQLFGMGALAEDRPSNP